MSTPIQTGATARVWLIRVAVLLLGLVFAASLGSGFAQAQEDEAPSSTAPSTSESSPPPSDDDDESSESTDSESGSEGEAASEDFSSPFDAIDLKDSSGISVWRYQMSIDQGSASKPSAVVYSTLIEMVWGLYRMYTAMTIWFLGWVLSFEWLEWLLGPVEELSTHVQGIVDQLGLMPLFLTIAAFVAGVMLLRGRTTTFVYDGILACVIAALATGALSNPVGIVAGENGYLSKSRDAGLELAAGLGGEDTEAAASGELIQGMQSQMADTLIRQPTQLINFGKVIDTDTTEECIHEWETGHDNHPGNDRDTVKDNVAKCGEAGESMKEYADNPGQWGVVLALLFAFNGGIVALFCLVLSMLIILSAFTALFISLKLIWDLVWGLLPGPARSGLMLSAANLVIALISVSLMVLLASAFMQLLQALFSASEGKNLVLRMLFIFVIELICIGMTIKIWLNARKQGKGFAEFLSKRPGAAPSRPSQVSKGPSAVRSAARTYAVTKAAGKVAAGAASGGTTAAAGAAAAPILRGAAGAAAKSAPAGGSTAGKGRVPLPPAGNTGAGGGQKSLPPAGGDGGAGARASLPAAPSGPAGESAQDTASEQPARAAQRSAGTPTLQPAHRSTVQAGSESPEPEATTGANESGRDTTASGSSIPTPAYRKDDVIEGEVVSVRDEPIPHKREREAYRARSNQSKRGVRAAKATAAPSVVGGPQPGARGRGR